MIRDRGKIKWRGFMMPEHNQMLKKFNEEDRREKRPQLDQQREEEINQIILEAMEYNDSLAFKVYSEKNGHSELIIGTVHYIELNNYHFRVIDENGKLHRISINSIVDVYKA